MTLRTRGPRAGFTLVELLVVIAIIALLMGLLIPAVIKVTDAGRRADNSARLTSTGGVVSTFAGDHRFGQVKYVPAGQVDLAEFLSSGSRNPNFQMVVGPFRLRNSYTTTTTPDVNSFEAQYIARVFGSRVNLADLGNPAYPGNDTSAPILLDGNQCLVFFLGGIQERDAQGVVQFPGFSNDPQRPFTPRRVAGEERKTTGLEMSSKRYKIAPNGFAWLVDAWGNPIAYFSAYNGKAGKVSGNNPFAPGLSPYTNGGKLVNETSFQLISAGKDEVFGPGGDWTTSGRTAAGQDDQANFSKDLLGSGPQ